MSLRSQRFRRDTLVGLVEIASVGAERHSHDDADFRHDAVSEGRCKSWRSEEPGPEPPTRLKRRSPHAAFECLGSEIHRRRVRSVPETMEGMTGRPLVELGNASGFVMASLSVARSSWADPSMSRKAIRFVARGQDGRVQVTLETKRPPSADSKNIRQKRSPHSLLASGVRIVIDPAADQMNREVLRNLANRLSSRRSGSAPRSERREHDDDAHLVRLSDSRQLRMGPRASSPDSSDDDDALRPRRRRRLLRDLQQRHERKNVKTSA